MRVYRQKILITSSSSLQWFFSSGLSIRKSCKDQCDTGKTQLAISVDKSDGEVQISVVSCVSMSSFIVDVFRAVALTSVVVVVTVVILTRMLQSRDGRF